MKLEEKDKWKYTKALNSYGLVESSLVPRADALMFGLLFTSLGFRIRGLDRDFNSDKIFLTGTIVFSVLHFLERIFIVSSVEQMTVYYGGDYSLFTAPMAICFFLYAVSRKDWGEKSVLNTYGKNSLWGYLLHPVFLGFLIGISSLIGDSLGYTLKEDLGWSIIVSIFSYILMMKIIIRGRKSKSR